jgi:threonine/homoserine/homoserine lactone efflux protein
MPSDAALAAAAGFGVAALAGLAGLLWLRRATAGGKPLGPQALLGATALRFALTLAGAIALALGWREQAAAALVGLGVGYLALLALETRWALGRAGNRAGERAPKAPAGEKE